MDAGHGSLGLSLCPERQRRFDQGRAACGQPGRHQYQRNEQRRRGRRYRGIDRDVRAHAREE
jgi:hypothetical protein